jgi:glutamate dehydrogenase
VNRSLKTMHAPTETDPKRTALGEVREQFVANADGVTCSYFEQVQGHTNYYWNRTEVLSKVDSTMRTAFAEVHKRGEREQVPLRDAAYLIAVERVAHACRERGWV